ncbi:MAG TPA: hypothetical protein VFR32_10360 [Gaiellaceae bacterium]|nr:hypothetical protein [Gaiellaceae bacterium]
MARSQDASRISKPWTIAAAAAAALVVGVTGFAASSAPPPNEARALGALFFNKNMARAEVVQVRGGIVHDYRIDQGKVVAVRPGAIELLERDGTRQLIPVSPTAQVLVNGRFTTLSAIPLRMNAITIRDGDEPASTVRATGQRK